MHFDIFNGDADGILALHQLRLQQPIPDATLVTGVKRDICLLSKIPECRNATINVFDVSLDSNRSALLTLLEAQNTIHYIDHHHAGTIPDNPLLTTHINPAPTVCTSLIVDQLIEGKYRSWAVAGAFGDNLHESASRAASSLSLNTSQVSQLRELGELLNYNGYGTTLSDLHFAPAELYKALRPYDDPFRFLAESEDILTLRRGHEEDMALAMEQQEVNPGKKNRVYIFPSTAWARRVAGVFSNLRAREKKEAAHALIIANDDGSLRISVRAPLNDRKNADTLCLSFPTGGGRMAAAGINQLPEEMLDTFLERFQMTFP